MHKKKCSVFSVLCSDRKKNRKGSDENAVHLQIPTLHSFSFLSEHIYK